MDHDKMRIEAMNDQHSAKIDELILSLGKEEVVSRVAFMANATRKEFIRRMKADMDFCNMIRGLAEHSLSESVVRIIARKSNA